LDKTAVYFMSLGDLANNFLLFPHLEYKSYLI